MAMTLRLDDDVVEALRRRAEREGRSMQQVARIAIRDYLERMDEDEAVDAIAREGARRYAHLLERLAQA